MQDLIEDCESKDTVNTSVDILQSNGIEFVDLEWFWNIPFSGVSGIDLHLYHQYTLATQLPNSRMQL